ncbi:MAG TPA: hypothetical protein P5255_10880 [Phycisphaerae bacterium]|nr:hypothetical protein [Phycisphaerae bacterium]
MSGNAGNLSGPRGGLRPGAGLTRGWHWERVGELLVSNPVRCKRDQCYLARGTAADGMRPVLAEFAIRFLQDGRELAQRRLALHARNGHDGELLGWIQTPENATHLQILVPRAASANVLGEVTFHAVAERDPKCHPLANVPRWNTYRPPFPIQRVLLPASLAELASAVPELAVTHVRPRSRGALAHQANQAACVLDPAWVDGLGLTWEDLLRLADRCWLLVDLETAGKLLSRAGVRGLELFTDEAQHGLMSARVEYADVQTRGFALQDVFPYGALTPAGGFCVRALRANRAWRRLADELALATLLASETPSPRQTGHVLSAAAALGRGELVITDLPWLVAGSMGPPIAPRLAQHALRMHLGAPVEDDLQYWNRWDDSQIVVRDICDLARRYPPLQTVRWTPSPEGNACLGVYLPAQNRAARATTVLIHTGRIDNLDLHGGLPPEPMMIIMKQLAREAREATAWAQRYLANVNVVWQFDTAAGLRYAVNYASAESFDFGTVYSSHLHPLNGRKDCTPSSVRSGAAPRNNPARGENALLTQDEGIFGDGSLNYLRQLMSQLRRRIEAQAV